MQWTKKVLLSPISSITQFSTAAQSQLQHFITQHRYCHNWYRTHRVMHSARAHMCTVSQGKIHLMLRNNFIFQSSCFPKQFLDTIILYGHVGSLGPCDQALEASHFCQYYLYRQLQVLTGISRANSVLTSSEKLTHSQMTDRVQYRHSLFEEARFLLLPHVKNLSKT